MIQGMSNGARPSGTWKACDSTLQRPWRFHLTLVPELDIISISRLRLNRITQERQWKYESHSRQHLPKEFLRRALPMNSVSWNNTYATGSRKYSILSQFVNSDAGWRGENFVVLKRNRSSKTAFEKTVRVSPGIRTDVRWSGSIRKWDAHCKRYLKVYFQGLDM